MITDSNGMPVLQPLVDDAATSTFNAAFALIGVAMNKRRSFNGTSAQRSAWSSSGSVQTGDFWQDTNGDQFGYFYTGSAWQGVTGDVDGSISFATLSSGAGTYLKRYATNMVEGYYNAEYSAALADGSTIGNLPTGFRPSGTLYLPAMMAIGGAAGACSVLIGSDGEIKVYGIGGSGNKHVGFSFSFRRP